MLGGYPKLFGYAVTAYVTRFILVDVFISINVINYIEVAFTKTLSSKFFFSKSTVKNFCRVVAETNQSHESV